MWELLALVVFAASFAQSATGIGFGVIAGPFLIHAYGYDRAVVETALFSLVVAAVCSVKSIRWVEFRSAAILVGMLPVGLAIGAGMALVVTQSIILVAFGILLLALGSTLLRQELQGVPHSTITPTAGSGRRGFVGAALVAGVTAYLFAAPGPVAAWGLARADLGARSIRGTLSVYFIAAYGALVLTFGLLDQLIQVDWPVFGRMAVACFAGSIAGAIYGDRLSARVLRIAIGVIVSLSGLSTLAVLIWRLATNA